MTRPDNVGHENLSRPRRKHAKPKRGHQQPSPLAGEGWVGGCNHRGENVGLTPHPNPPPQGGRGPESSRAAKSSKNGSTVLILGASVRAAAFSALRAGLKPWCGDLFADADLVARCPAMKLSGRYPDGFVGLADIAPSGPWLYTGGLENYPRLVDRISDGRTLWGNNAAVLRTVRDPTKVATILRDAGLPSLAVRDADSQPPDDRRWLLKPRNGSGGLGISFWQGKRSAFQKHCYLQEFIEGDSWAALFVGDGKESRLLGVTRQLVGKEWLHCGPFQYCGSIGPLDVEPVLRHEIEKIGSVLAEEAGPAGLFGVDGIHGNGRFWPVEINPRYPASAEVLEYATGMRSIAFHRHVFDRSAPVPELPGSGGAVIGKAILFARESLVFPADGPWVEVSRFPPSIEKMPSFADIPHAGDCIKRGQPVLTFFARGRTAEPCEAELRCLAGDLDRWLWKK